MKTLAYRTIIRLDEGVDEYSVSINEGFVIAFIDENDNLIKMEGLFTNEYFIAEVQQNHLCMTLFASNVLESIFSNLDLTVLTPYSKNVLEIWWEGEIEIDELEFPLNLEITRDYKLRIRSIDESSEEYEFLGDAEAEDEDEDEDSDEFDDDEVEIQEITEVCSIYSIRKIEQIEHEQLIKRLEGFKNEHVFITEREQ